MADSAIFDFIFLYALQIGDLLGTAFLALAWMVLSYTGDDFLKGIENGVSGENVTVSFQEYAF